MCYFRYHRYDNCGHKCIELITYCVPRLWKAGLQGQLMPCPELHYLRNTLELSPLAWEGMHGYCKACQQKYAMPETTTYRSLNDLVIPLDEEPRRDSCLPSNTPYIYTPRVCKTVPELLGIAAQIRDNELPEGSPIVFPSILSVYDGFESGRSVQWLAKGYCQGQRVDLRMSPFLRMGGMSPWDLVAVAKAVEEGREVSVWREEFEERGMPLESFMNQVMIIKRKHKPAREGMEG